MSVCSLHGYPKVYSQIEFRVCMCTCVCMLVNLPIEIWGTASGTRSGVALVTPVMLAGPQLHSHTLLYTQSGNERPRDWQHARTIYTHPFPRCSRTFWTHTHYTHSSLLAARTGMGVGAVYIRVGLEEGREKETRRNKLNSLTNKRENCDCIFLFPSIAVRIKFKVITIDWPIFNSNREKGLNKSG